jgi:hypothetical protein
MEINMMSQKIQRKLKSYCDLTPAMLVALDDPNQGHPNSLCVLEAGGLLAAKKRTDLGQQLLERAREIVAGVWRAPGPEFPVAWLDTLHITVARCRQAGLRTFHVKALRHLAHFPGTTWKYLCSIYGAEALRVLLERELARGEPRHGAPWWPTDVGLQVLSGLVA